MTVRNYLRQYRYSWAAILILVLSTFFLYFPFLHNNFIFDDYGLFKTGSVFDYVERVFDIYPRTFPYFTLGIFAILGESVELNRIISLILHIVCGCMLYILVRSFLIEILEISSTEKEKEFSATVISFLCAAWFLLHPISVYGAGYLVQRTILFATLFSLLSLWFYRRAFAQNRTGDIFTAALFYFLAVMSKEHAILLPFAIVGFTTLYSSDLKTHLKRALLYISLCAPMTIWIFLAKNHMVAAGNEPDAAMLIAQLSDIPSLENSQGKWFVSAVLQTLFFFKYIFYWIFPDIRQLSIDMRIDFSQIWSSWWIFPVSLIFCFSPLIALIFLRKKGASTLFSCGYLYTWIIFLTELVSVRFQEPFVLYRSYLWAPGYAVMLAAICIYIPRRLLATIGICVLCIFFMFARDRLNSFKNENTVWKDAAEKLQKPSVPGSDRIFYNRGRAYLQEKKYVEAIDDFSQAITQNSNIYQIYLNRAVAFYALEDYEKSYLDIEKSISMNKKDGSIFYLRGLVLQQQGCLEAAISSYKEARNLGNLVASMKIEELAGSNVSREKTGLKDFACPA